MKINPIVLYILLGIALIVLIDTIGSLASRKFQFNYAALIPVSLLTYGFIGYLIAGSADLNSVLLGCGLMGLFDSTIGWKLSLHYRANMELSEEEVTRTPVSVRIIMVLVIAFACGYVGYLAANH